LWGGKLKKQAFSLLYFQSCISQRCFRPVGAAQGQGQRGAGCDWRWYPPALLSPCLCTASLPLLLACVSSRLGCQGTCSLPSLPGSHSPLINVPSGATTFREHLHSFRVHHLEKRLQATYSHCPTHSLPFHNFDASDI